MKYLPFVFAIDVIFALGFFNSSFAQTTLPTTQPICIAADVVVDPLGNDANPGTRRLPVKTIGKGIVLAGGGGILLVNPGRYAEALKPMDGQSFYGYGATVDGEHTRPSLASGGSNVTIKGIMFITANSPAQQGAITAGSGWRLEDVEADGNSEAGIDVHGSATAPANGVVLLRCRAIGNGREGIKGGYATNVLIQDCVSQGNNPNNINSAGNEAGGGKWSQCDGVSFVNDSYLGNHGYGLWLDFNNRNISVKGGTFSGQVWVAPAAYWGAAMMVEISQGPITIDGATFTGNSGGGVSIGESSNIALSNNQFLAGQYVDMRDMNSRSPYRVGHVTFTGNSFTNAFISTNGSKGQYPWDDSQFAAKHITGSGNVFSGTPVGYIGPGTNRQVNTTVEFTRRTGIGAVTSIQK